jgi:hypothetical protein
MTHLADRPRQTRTHEQVRRQNIPRPVGNVALRGAVQTPDIKTRPPSPSEKLMSATRAAVIDRLMAVQSAEMEPQMPLERIKRAYLLQNRRLRGEKDELTGEKVVDTEELTTAEFASEQLARVILFSPMAADADKSENTWQLSQFNDMLAASAVAVSPSVLPNLKTILEGEIKQFNDKVAGRNYNISGQIARRLRGIDAEIAATRALKTNTELDVSMPATKGDLEGKDITVQRDGTIVHIDVKRKASYKKALIKMVEKGILTKEEARWGDEDGYAVTTQDKDGGWKYLVDADALGKIGNLEYDQEGVKKTSELIEKLLGEVERTQQ